MNTYRKEKNLIYISIDGVNGEYILNINTGIFLNSQCTPLKILPHRNAFTKLTGEGANLQKAIYVLFRYCNIENFHRKMKGLRGAEKLDGTGIRNLNLNLEQYGFIDDNFALFCKYIKANPINDNTVFPFDTFEKWVRWELIKKEAKFDTSLLNLDIYTAMLGRKRKFEWNAFEWDIACYYLVRGKLWEYSEYNSIVRIYEYLDYCRFIDVLPKKVNNFPREYVETKNTYLLRKQEYDDKKLQQNYQIHSKAWEFKFGNYQVVIPKCGQDIVTEGQRMNHCVGSYVNLVVYNETYICFIRKIDKIETPYITCEVTLEGTIAQYYLAYDKLISKQEDLDFEEAFQKYLKEVW